MKNCCYLVLLLALLLPRQSPAQSFSWQDEALFLSLEQDFLAARQLPAAQVVNTFTTLEAEGQSLLRAFDPQATELPEAVLLRFELLQFKMAALAAAHAPLLQRLQKFSNDIRLTMLPASARWLAATEQVQQLLYRIIYGGRVAVEEAWLQNQAPMPSLLQLAEINPAVPSAVVEGVRVYSGDILLSRAGAATSALISRGNDYRGKFSHAALLYIDAATHTPRIIEAHIEIGVVVSSLEQYLADKKQRVLVLRLNPDHAQLLETPDLAHAAAEAMFKRAEKKLIPYDFAMDYENDHKLFCSEVVYHAYRYQGVYLWRLKTVMSQPGLQAWLGDMGVKYFETMAPSDIEYDSQVVAVAEWRDFKVLKADRIDSALMDTLLQEAESGLRLDYPLYKRPVAGLVKLWSGFKSMFGLQPSIPRGMSVTAALKVSTLMEKVFPLLRQRLVAAESAFYKREGYMPPYWSLMQLAGQVLAQSMPELSAHLVRE